MSSLIEAWQASFVDPYARVANGQHTNIGMYGPISLSAKDEANRHMRAVLAGSVKPDWNAACRLYACLIILTHRLALQCQVSSIHCQRVILFLCRPIVCRTLLGLVFSN